MKKIKITYFLLGVLVLTFSSCEKTYLEDDRVTYFADIVIAGEEQVFIAAGSEYTDAGAKAYENGVEIDVKATSTVDAATPGAYSVQYSAVNSDGFSKNVSRSVLVYDASTNATDLSGTYTANVDRNGSEAYAATTVTLTAVSGVDGLYQISDWIAGFYAVGRGYGGAYAFPGYIQITGSNQVVEISMTNAWGDPFDSVVGTYDPGTGVISYTANWLDGTYAFVVDMSK